MNNAPILDQSHVLDIAVSPDFANDTICFAGTASGIIRSVDGGNTWDRTGDTADPATAISCSPSFAQNGLVLAGSVGGFLRSGDAGRTWQGIPCGSPPPVISDIAWLTDRIVLAGTVEDGIFRSDDEGVTWKPANTGVLDYEIQNLAVQPGTPLVFAATASSLMVSQTGGKSWLELPNPGNAGTIALLATGHHPDGSPVLLAGTSEDDLYSSTDNGANWAKLATLTGLNLSLDITTSGDFVVSRQGEVIVSLDGGTTWQNLLRSRAPMIAATLIDRNNAERGILAAFSNGQISRITPAARSR
jgi:photosystem II stability/assembly factor-like uncharacterized protein